MTLPQPEKYLSLVRSIANRLAYKLPQSVSANDLYQVGMEGLLEAAQRYQAETGVPFPAYASLRIRGAIQDHLRRQDWPTRRVRQKIKRLEKSRASLEQRLGRTPNESELAEELDLPLHDIWDVLARAESDRHISLDGLVVNRPEETEDVPFVPREPEGVEDRIEREELVNYLVAALAELPQKEYVVLALYYYEFLILREIAEVLRMSEAAISLRHASALEKLKKTLWWRYRMDEIRYSL